jgi:RNA polymerase sigma-70 factor (ECF subfamily)
MNNQSVTIVYKLAKGTRICLDVSVSVHDLLEQAERQISSQRRSDKRHLDFMENVDDMGGDVVFQKEGVADLVIRMDSRERLDTAISKLSVVQQRRLRMYFFNDLSYSQIALLESVSPRAVRATIQRALERLRTLKLE